MKITIYSKSGCPYCEKIKAVASYLVETKNYTLEVYDLGIHFDREEFYNKFEVGSTFPQILIDDIHTGGCSDTIKYLQENKVL